MLLEWLSKLREIWFSPSIHGSLNISMGPCTVSMHGLVESGEQALEKRVAQLEESYRNLVMQLSNVQAEYKKEIIALEKKVKELLDHNMAESKNMLAKVSIGGFKLQLFGVMIATYGALIPVLA